MTIPAALLGIEDGLILNGTVHLGDNATIGFIGPQTFDNGTIALDGVWSGISADGTGRVLTLGPEATVRAENAGKGFDHKRFVSGSTTSALGNQGIIPADINDGALTVFPIGAHTVANEKMMEVTNEGSLVANFLEGDLGNTSAAVGGHL